MTYGRIDVHSHLLPGVDDGCRDFNDAFDCARRLVAAGYTHGFCTPHIWPHLENNVRNIPERVGALQTALDAEGINYRLLAGGELNLNTDIRSTPPSEIISLGLAGRYVLLDFWCNELGEHFDPSIRWLQSLGLTVIIAHPERVRAVQDDPGLLDHFDELGALLQGNLQCLADPPHTHNYRLARRFLEQGRYFVLGSDTHRPETLDHRLRGLAHAIDLVGDAEIDRLTRQNPRTFLTGLEDPE